MRILVAGPGNYAATWLLTALLARTLPGGALTTTLVATLLSFVLFACGVVATFAVRDGGRAGLCLGAIAAPASAALAIVGPTV